MPSPTAGRLRLVLVLSIMGVALAGCTTAAGFSYGEYRSGPGYETERFYESRVYGDTSQGVGRETCRVVARRQVDPFGESIVREETVCDGL